MSNSYGGKNWFESRFHRGNFPNFGGALLVLNCSPGFDQLWSWFIADSKADFYAGAYFFLSKRLLPKSIFGQIRQLKNLSFLEFPIRWIKNRPSEALYNVSVKDSPPYPNYLIIQYRFGVKILLFCYIEVLEINLLELGSSWYFKRPNFPLRWSY